MGNMKGNDNMKILGLNSQVEFAGVTATVTGLNTNGLTLTNDKTQQVVTMSLEQATQTINEKMLKIIKV